MNWLWFFAGLVGGFIAIRYSKWLADNIVHIDFADKLLGRTGTFVFWKVAGVGFIAFGFWALFNL